jgi:hypothetical protein
MTKTRLRTQVEAVPTPSFTPARGGVLRRKSSCGGIPGPRGDCEASREKKLWHRLGDVRALSSIGYSPFSASEVPPIVHEVLCLPGQPLNSATSAFTEPRFGHDFGKVHVHSTFLVGTLQRAPDDEAPSPKKEEGTETEPAAAAEVKPAPPCDPKGLVRADYLKEPGTSTDDFGLTQLSGTVSVPVVHTSKTPKGLVLDPTGAQLPPLTSVFTAADTFIEGTVIFFGESTECPSGRKYPQQWRILPAGAQKIREGELEHCADFHYAFDNSLQRYADVVNDLAAKKRTFPTQKAAEQYVTRIVGPAPNTWPDVFECLAKKTKIRDDLKWHTPRPLTRPPRLEDDCKFARTYVTGSGLAEVGKHPSAEIIKDCGERPPAKGKGTAVPPGSKTKSTPAPKVVGKAELRRKPGASVPLVVHTVLSQPGQSLDHSTRAFFEPRFGYDFSRVRVHTDARAAESARSVSALAYAVGRDVVFGAGQYAPNTLAGRRLLAHELTHIVQQDGTAGAAIRIGSQDDRAEQEARTVSENVLRGDAFPVAAAAHPVHDTAQRQVGKEEDKDEDERHRISVVTESHAPILRRQGPDIPPPPPAYPHFSHIFFGEVATKIGELEITCEDRRERGFWIFWNDATKTAHPGPIEIGDQAPKNCSKPASIELGPMPRDRRKILVAGWFHNHPPVWPGCAQSEVGPSKRDKDTSSRLKLPGLVQDFVKPGPNTSCKGSPRGTFFFGPPRREA